MPGFKTLVDYSIGKVLQKTNIRLLQHRKDITKNQHSKKIKFGQEWPIKFFESRQFYRVGRGRGNKQYFIFGLIGKYIFKSGHFQELESPDTRSCA